MTKPLRPCSNCGNIVPDACVRTRNPCPWCGKPHPYSVTLLDNSM